MEEWINFVSKNLGTRVRARVLSPVPTFDGVHACDSRDGKPETGGSLQLIDPPF